MPALLAAVAAALLAVPVASAPAQGDAVFVGWTAYLPGWTDEFIPTSENDCVAGRPTCLKATLKELSRINDANISTCSHNAVFSLAYLRMTQTYGWTREIPGYYQDVPFANHQDAVFAKYYTDAFTNWSNGNRAAVPESWLIAFDAARDKKVTASGDLLLGMNAHINRDLAFVVAGVGTVAPDGSSRKPDYDKVEEWLATAAAPMSAESAARLDPTMDDSNESTGLVNGGVMQVVSLWRENAWRNAERLIMASTPAERAAVAASIEAQANTIAHNILATNSYTPFNTTVARDQYCSVHNGDTAPMPYDFGTPSPWGY